jgi:tRNA A37 threonylcarbamoyladenosine synthetase subunit TsaC/SUA5/YrdC
VKTDAQRAYEILRDDGVVLLPTDVGYGLVACGDAGVARIYELKGRPHSKPCVTVGTPAILDDIAGIDDARVRAWVLDIALHTPIAVINPVRPQAELLARLTPCLRGQVTSDGSIATFMNAGKLVVEIAELALSERRLVFGSSANLAFTGNNYGIDDVPASIRDGVDLVIADGVARYRNPERLATTILDLSTGRFVRAGINHAIIEAGWRGFCTGRGDAMVA